ncbi:MAG: LysR family transcriptional regulator [Thermodesulfobacteriota bacterium]
MNYHHLYYFWMISREGSLSRAANRLRLTHSTLSEQLKMLEDFLGQKLFDRMGRRLVLTQFGAEVAQYADEIFRLGNELIEMARGRSQIQRSVFRAGVVGSIPKTIVYRLLEPSVEQQETFSLEIRQGTLNALMEMMFRNRLHVILSDQPPRDAMIYRVTSRKLGDTELFLYGAPEVAERYRPGFPDSLADAPLLLPARGTNLRQSLDQWFADRALEMNVIGEFDDSGLLRTFGVFERGLFPVRSVLVDEVEETHAVQRVGLLAGIRESYYAVYQNRRVTHPYILEIINAARKRLLSSSPAKKHRKKKSVERAGP